MKQFTFDNQNWRVPENWGEVLWGSYIQMVEFSDWYGKNPDKISNFDLEQWYFNILVQVEKAGEWSYRPFNDWSKPPQTFWDMDRGEFVENYLALSKILNKKPIDQKPPISKTFTIGGIEWGFNLESNKWKVQDIHTVERFQKEYEGYELTENIVSTFFRPIIREKDESTGEEQVKFDKFQPARFDWIKRNMRMLSCETILSVASFFLTFSLASGKDIKSSINQELKLMNGVSQSQTDTQQ